MEWTESSWQVEQILSITQKFLDTQDLISCFGIQHGSEMTAFSFSLMCHLLLLTTKYSHHFMLELFLKLHIFHIYKSTNVYTNVCRFSVFFLWVCVGGIFLNDCRCLLHFTGKILQSSRELYTDTSYLLHATWMDCTDRQ